MEASRTLEHIVPVSVWRSIPLPNHLHPLPIQCYNLPTGDLRCSYSWNRSQFSDTFSCLCLSTSCWRCLSCKYTCSITLHCIWFIPCSVLQNYNVHDSTQYTHVGVTLPWMLFSCNFCHSHERLPGVAGFEIVFVSCHRPYSPSAEFTGSHTTSKAAYLLSNAWLKFAEAHEANKFSL